MKSRFTIATIVGLLGLVLLGFLSHGTHAGRANAQLVDTDPRAQPAKPWPAESLRAFVDKSQLRPAESRFGTPSFTSQPAAFNSQPHRSLAVASTQPIVLDLKDGPHLRGDTVGLSAFVFETIFGSVSIPVDTIAGLRMADDPRQPATICLSNGDSLTGVLATDSVTIKTAWGGATIGRDHIVSIVTTTEPVTWQQHEGRWRIAVAEPASNAVERTEEELRSSSNGEADTADHPPVLDSTDPPATLNNETLQPLPEPESGASS